jgi:hypothetical protein
MQTQLSSVGALARRRERLDRRLPEGDIGVGLGETGLVCSELLLP